MYGIFTYIWVIYGVNVCKCRKIYHTWIIWVMFHYKPSVLGYHGTMVWHHKSPVSPVDTPRRAENVRGALADPHSLGRGTEAAAPGDIERAGSYVSLCSLDFIGSFIYFIGLFYVILCSFIRCLCVFYRLFAFWLCSPGCPTSWKISIDMCASLCAYSGWSGHVPYLYPKRFKLTKYGKTQRITIVELLLRCNPCLQFLLVVWSSMASYYLDISSNYTGIRHCLKINP